MIDVVNLYKSYKSKKETTTILNGVNLHVPDGCVFGVIGGNGTGKTTFLNCLSGTCRQDLGEIKVDGKDIRAIREVPNVVGFVQDVYAGFPYMTGKEYLEYLGECAALPKEMIMARIEVLAQLFGMEKALNRISAYYSKGMKQKLSVMAVLLGNPKVVLMDEPTSNLDPSSKEEMKEVFKNLKQSKKSIIITTNSLYDVENYCDAIAFLKNGEISAPILVEDIASSEREGVIIKGDIEKLHAAYVKLAEHGVQAALNKDGLVVVCDTKDSYSIVEIIKENNIDVDGIITYKESFRDAFMREVKK